MKQFRKSILMTLLLISSIKIFAQTAVSNNPAQNDFMNSNGKIFVVMAVVVVIVVGLFIYLFNLDRKISKLEKRDI